MSNIWDRATVIRVYDMSVVDVINHEELSGPGNEDTLQSALDQLLTHLRRLDGGIAAGIDPHDLQVSRHTDEDTQQDTLTMRWRPGTLTIQMVGGPQDGQLLAFADAPWGVLAVSEPVTGFIRDEEDMKVLPIEHQHWEMTGWHVESRHWIYERTS